MSSEEPKQSRVRRKRCERCTLPRGRNERCQWCEHDHLSEEHVAELTERHRRWLLHRQDRAERTRRRKETGERAFMTCPACSQWGRYGQCEHCWFDVTDEQAVGGLTRYFEHRAARRTQQRHSRVLRGGAHRRACDRCWLTLNERTTACRWCGHDSADEDAVSGLLARRLEVLALRSSLARDRVARRAWIEDQGVGPFMACAYCKQWGPFGACIWCNFDATDAVAVEARSTARAWQAEYRATRRTELWARIQPPSRRDPSHPGFEARRFMTCPACHQWGQAPICAWCDFDMSDTGAVKHLTEERLFVRRRWQVRRHTIYTAVRGVARFDLGEQAALLVFLLKWIVLGAIVGVLAGLGSAFFLQTLSWVTSAREAHPWLLFGLPIAGFIVGLAYHYGGSSANAGNNLIIDEIHEQKAWIPRRMAPLVYVGTILTHLFGGSAGREGTAIQMAGSLTDGTFRSRRLSPADRRLLLIAAIAGGFGSVFGVPLAGCVFALEVQAVGRIRYDALVPALTASIVGDLVVRGLGVHHTPVPHFGAVALTAPLFAKVAFAGLIFGLVSVVFSELTHGLKRVFSATIRWAPARPLLGGVLVVGLTYLVGNYDYLGLSIPLMTKALAGGAGVVLFAFALKLVFTSVTLGSGFQGGEVTPLFVIGATLGASLGRLLGAPIPLMAAIGFVAVFAGATNTPLACTVMAVELFGAGPIVLFAVACVISYVASAHRGIYNSQRIDTPKGSVEQGDDTLDAVSRRRRHWLPPMITNDEPGEGVG